MPRPCGTGGRKKLIPTRFVRECKPTNLGKGTNNSALDSWGASSDLTSQPRRDYTWCLTVLFGVRSHTATHHALLALSKSRPIARSPSNLGGSFFRVPNVARLGFAGVSSPVWVDATSLRGSEKLGETDNLSHCASGPLCETLSSKARLPMPDFEAAPGGVAAPTGRLTTVNRLRR